MLVQLKFGFSNKKSNKYMPILPLNLTNFIHVHIFVETYTYSLWTQEWFQYGSATH